MTFIVAEAGINHNGKIENAHRLVAAATNAQANAVKFQLFNSQRLWGDDRVKHLELSFADMTSLAAHCKDMNIEFMCTPFGVEEVEFLAPLVNRMKVASGCLTNRDLLKAVDKTGLPVILSTGMSEVNEILDAISMLSSDTTLLHCTSSYPCKIEDVNLKAMDTLRSTGLPVGYSDHTEGIIVALAAVAKGATYLEKHLTLDRKQTGPDHKASIDPYQFRIMVHGIRQIEQALGDGIKRVMPSEEALRKLWR